MAIRCLPPSVHHGQAGTARATDNDTIANPSLLDNVSTQRRIKLFEFGLWAERMVGQGKHASLSDIIKEELPVYESEGFGLSTAPF